MTGQDMLAVHRARFVNFTPANITSLAFSHKSDISQNSSNSNKLTPSDLRLAVGRANGNIEIWNPRNNWVQELIIQGGKDRSIEGLCWSNVHGEPLRLFSIGGSTVVTEWNLATGLPLKNYDCNAGVIWSIAINESQDRLSLGCDNGIVVIVDISGGVGFLEHDSVLVRQEARVLTLTWNRDDFVIGGCSDGRIRIWSTQKNNENKGRLLHTMKVDKSKHESTLVWSVLYLPATNQIVSGDSTGSVKYWDFHYATLNQSFKTHDADVLCLTTDMSNTHVFSAGVDRKIYQYSKSTSKQPKDYSNKWIITSNRLLHANDVRAMSSYQSKGADFLVSGGVEKTLVISSVSSFADGNYKKMPLVVPFAKNILLNKVQRLVVMWYESTVKIWRVGQDLESEKNYTLVCKLTLRDEQNISVCSMSPDGTVLVVGRLSTTKVFHLQPMNNKLKVTKLENDLLLKTGTKYVQFIDNSNIIICSSEDELFTIDLESEYDEEMNELELPDIQQTKSSIKLPYMNNINNLQVQDKYAVISHSSGSIVLINLETKECKVLARLMNYITTLTINIKRGAVVVVTAENKIYEFNINNGQQKDGEEEESILTQWSKNNTENLPRQFQDLKEKCLGIFLDGQNENKVWFWGATWLANLDFSIDLPSNLRKKPKKRSRDGLTITDESNFLNDGEDEDDNNELDTTESLEIMTSQPTKLKTKDSTKPKSESQAFFFTEKYKPILYTDFISAEEIVVVERPPFMVSGQQSAFNLPKILF